MKTTHQRLLKDISFIVLILISSNLSQLSGQCTNNITLNIQQQVDDFASNYGCTILEASLFINGKDITNLSGLSNLTRVGRLTILQTSLTDLSGLESLETVDGGLNIYENSDLISLHGLHYLSAVGGIDLWQNPKLADISQLFNVTRTTAAGVDTTFDGRIWIGENPMLSTLYGLHNITYIDGELNLRRNALLQDLSGLASLQTVRKQFWIEDNDALVNLTGLESLVSARELTVFYNDAFVSPVGLSRLTEVPGGLSFVSNSSQTNVIGLDNLIQVGTLFRVMDCPVTSLEGLKIESIGGIPHEDAQGLILANNTALQNLSGLESLRQVTGNVLISTSSELLSFDGLHNLKTIGGWLRIESNGKLENIDALEGLESIGNELQITSNYVLSFCSVGGICKYLRESSGLVFISSNGSQCESAEEVLSNCSPVSDIKLIDANLRVNGIQSVDDIAELLPFELDLLGENRMAVAADGISKVLLKIKFYEPGNVTFAGDESDKIEMPWGASTHLLNNEHYAFALYTPPHVFEPKGSTYMFEDEVEAFDVHISLTLTEQGDVRNGMMTIPIVRSPVVLMHGIYSDPAETWKTAAEGGIGMYDRLANAGFKVFAVNYAESNGSSTSPDRTSFLENAKVLWGDVYASNGDGIKDALTYYRDTLSIAVTQAEVVGHGMGGILPRVYASEYYNPDYKRAENFMSGDIHRLITIAAPHHGSHLAELQDFLRNLSPFNIGLYDWIVTQAFNFLSSWGGGYVPSAAIRDMLPEPMGEALELIGPTQIPSHAITGYVPVGALRNAQYDINEEYYDLYWYITMLMYQNKDVRTEYLEHKIALVDMGLQASTTIAGGNPDELFPGYDTIMLYKTMLEDAISKAGIVLSVMDGTFEPPSNLTIFKYVLGETSMGDILDPLLEIFVSGSDPIGVALDYFLDVQVPSPQQFLLNYLKVNEKSIEGIRSLVFNNDYNDGVVRVQSQSGELEKECPECVSRIENMFHGFAPKYASVQDRVLELLQGGMEDFHEPGFPPIDHAQLIYFPPDSINLFKIPRTGEAAICQSGMVPTHARAFARIADEQNLIIITRPVNPDGTPLIARGAATKGMNIKPKSSNWGPQQGYLPVNQRYSKLWKVYEGTERSEKIMQYNVKAQENIVSGIAVPRQLKVEVCNGAFSVFIDENRNTGSNDVNAEDEVVLVPIADPAKVCTWGSDFSLDMHIVDCEPIGSQHMLTPLYVMATPNVLEDDGTTPRLLTADYDLLMVGFYDEDLGPPMPPALDFQAEVGQITDEQKELLTMLNDAVSQAGYRGGKVVHHGPENQFSASPYIDYPLTVFAPDHIPNGFFNHSTGGKILSIDMGPTGFRDYYLKQFVNRMRKEGYDLYHNPHAPGWKWTWNEAKEGYEFEDAEDLAHYVEQLPENHCDKYGDEIGSGCGDQIPPLMHGEHLESAPGGREPDDKVRIRITPNPVAYNTINITLHDALEEYFSYIISDAFGNVLLLKNGMSEQSIDISSLMPGIYTVHCDAVGVIGRFIKM